LDAVLLQAQRKLGRLQTIGQIQTHDRERHRLAREYAMAWRWVRLTAQAPQRDEF
jgi:hypothetical protein